MEIETGISVKNGTGVGFARAEPKSRSRRASFFFSHGPRPPARYGAGRRSADAARPPDTTETSPSLRRELRTRSASEISRTGYTKSCTAANRFLLASPFLNYILLTFVDVRRRFTTKRDGWTPFRSKLGRIVVVMICYQQSHDCYEH
ncbi:hypothetical protein EVAR_93615_1 [Eumeta japonica]|uniref:Uncharacterized protein n=1 Tax=Eumeta variegata TaxID=151549 RepID=A0A4C1TQQ5_EUMVA|nr:hypothetical protein EVAR_93615_1 [Eumeta japonica]